MTHLETYAAGPRPVRLHLRARLAGALHWLVACDARYRERRRIERLDDERLDDCGLARSQAATEAGKPFWQP